LALRDAPARYLVVPDAAGPWDAIVVMAGDPGYERTATAARLMQEGRARLLVLTGAEEIGPGDSAWSLRDEAVRRGVRPESIRMENVSTSTWSAAVQVEPILRAEGVRSVAVVTSPYHLRRAQRAAQRAWPGIGVSVVAASPAAWRPEGWWKSRFSAGIVAMEYAKLVYYAARGWI
jgi:uncharacterized SAM-binding protein YcdF (DUF218 family)